MGRPIRCCKPALLISFETKYQHSVSSGVARAVTSHPSAFSRPKCIGPRCQPLCDTATAPRPIRLCWPRQSAATQPQGAVPQCLLGHIIRHHISVLLLFLIGYVGCQLDTNFPEGNNRPTSVQRVLPLSLNTTNCLVY